MKPVLLDSDIIIEVMRRRNSNVTARWEHVIEELTPVTCTPATLAELPEFAALEARIAATASIHEFAAEDSQSQTLPMKDVEFF